ncbi:5291_t:CDS:2 [Acaulospora colombiana]|uniref:5291_t:CDS:1 n=1 Tax=Acaulospora colombiana TaxID=27376 RepID=A0ACA9KFJ2_9GLOM|nr:5291_t:CDS:2 [Acaulospora colombiana]
MSSNNRRIPLEDAITVGGEAISRTALEIDVRLIMVDFEAVRAFEYQLSESPKIRFYHFHVCLVELQLFLDPLCVPREDWPAKMWKSLSHLHKYCQQHDLFDAEYIYERLVAESAFELVAVVDPCGEYGRDRRKKRKMIPNSISEIRREMTMAPMGEFEDPDSLNKLEHIATQYYTKKRKISDTEEAKVASRKVTRQKMKSNPAGDYPLDIWQYIPFAMQATVRAMERDAEARSSGTKTSVGASNSQSDDLPYLP